MTLADAVWRGAMMLLPGGRTLTDADISVLRRRFPEQRIRIADPALDSIVDFEDDSMDSKTVAGAMAKTAEVMDMIMDDTRRQRTRANNSNFSDIERAVSNVIAYLLANPVGQILPKVPFMPETYLSDHMSNVFYLSMQLGTKLQWYVMAERGRQTNCRELSPMLARSLLPLGLGALYMDMGMMELSEYEDREGPLTDSDWERVHEHPNEAVKVLPKSMPAAARMIVRTHHETCDRSGYPMRPEPEKMHVFTRIIRIADVFDAATTPRPYRPAKSAIRVLWEMTHGPQRLQFDPTLVAAFNELVMPFPVGTRIELDDQQTAVVVGHSKDPFRPKVVIAIDERGRVKPAEAIGDAIELDEDCGRRMARVDGEDVSYLYKQVPAESPAACDTPAAK
ncbi:hypothetical protein HED60_20715 [Planctomycetales bacterium ZRK34]|nr:hypothetical protein HED60_20715 [Planctomycetales bacterium ZRK34]